MRVQNARRSALLATLLLSACAAKDIPGVQDIDWRKGDIVHVALSEQQCTPSSLHFQRGRAYRLRLTNTGQEVQDFASKPFFQAIAAARLIAPDGATSLPRLESIGISPGETKELDFVAVRPGTYSFECLAPLHDSLGMTGTATIE